MQKAAHELTQTNVLLLHSTALTAEVYATSMNALHLNYVLALPNIVRTP